MNATRNTGLVSGALVALVAAVASYTHMRTLAAEHGQAWLSWFIPLSVDGLMVVASLVIIVARRTGGRSVLAWLALSVGVAASLAANVASAGSDLVSRLVSAWPPVAFAVTFELVLRLIRSATATPSPTPPGDPGDQLANPGEPLVSSNDAAERDWPTLLTEARDLVSRAEAAGETMGRIRLADELRVSEHQARQLLLQLRQDAPAMVGGGSR